MNINYKNYFKENIYPQIKDFDFVQDLKEYDHFKKGGCLNFQTKNISELLNYKNLETLHCFRLTENQIKSFPLLNSVKNLNLTGSPIESLSFLNHFPNLIFLTLDSCLDLKLTNGLDQLNFIKILSFTGNMKLTDYKEVAVAKSLVSLKITGTTSGSILKIGNLEWVTCLQDLEELYLNNISTPKNELSPISALQNLKKLGIPVKSKLEQIAYLSGRLSKTECFYFSPFYVELDKNDNLLNCSKCGEPKIRLVGKGNNRVICKKCDLELFNDHVETFNKWKEKGIKENA